jgi:predicted DNA-binding transcriptional regulator AlpA
MRLTAEQSMRLTGRGRTKFYRDIKDGKLPPPAERDGKFVRWRAGDLIDSLTRARQ